MVWLSTTTCTPRRPRRRLRPPLLRNMRFSLRWLPSMAKHENLGRVLHWDAPRPREPWTKEYIDTSQANVAIRTRVLRVTMCGISGTRDAVSAATARSAAVVVRNFFQPILGVAHMAAKTVTKGRMAKGNDSAKAKGNVRLKCAAAVQFMRTRRWEALIAVCLEEGGTNNKWVGGETMGGRL